MMTEEQLKQEAEECMRNALFWLKLPISKENVEQGGSYILKLLEPKEKQIAEAKRIIKELLDFDFLPDVKIKKCAEQFLKEVGNV